MPPKQKTVHSKNPKELKYPELRWKCSPDIFEFKSTVKVFKDLYEKSKQSKKKLKPSTTSKKKKQ